MSSRTSFTCDICGREAVASTSTGHNPLGLPGGFLQIQLTARERIVETADVCSEACAQSLATKRYRRIYGGPAQTNDQLEEGAS